MVGRWIVRTGPALSDQLSFPAEDEAKARLIAAAPLLWEAAVGAGAELNRLVVGIAGPGTNQVAHKVARALAACEPIRQGDSHD
jgi:hypothetical protein